MPSVAEKRREFRRLHESGCFVLPNPWDIGSARYLQGLGFKAIASTSAGFAFTQGLPDGAMSREMMLAHLRELSAVADIPVNADFEGGFADDPDGVAESVRLCCDDRRRRACRSRIRPAIRTIRFTISIFRSRA